MLSEKQGIILLYFYVGGIVAYGSRMSAGTDLWLSVLCAILFTLPLVMLAARILSLFPGQDFFEILNNLFGKWVGKLLGILILVAILQFTIVNLWDQGTYIVTNSLAETPNFIFNLISITLVVLMIKIKLPNIARWAELFFAIVMPIVVGVILLLITEMNLENLQPVLYHGYQPVIKEAFFLFSSFFGEATMMMMVLTALKNQTSYYKVYLLGFLLAGFWLLTTFSSEIMVLGSDLFQISYFPIYVTVSKLNLDGLKRSEQIVLVLNVAFNFVKLTLNFYMLCYGVSKIFSLKHYCIFAIPLGLIVLNLSSFWFANIMDRISFQLTVCVYGRFIFVVILPVVIWIVAELRKNSLAKNN